jgi:hypothetical protein
MAAFTAYLEEELTVANNPRLSAVFKLVFVSLKVHDTLSHISGIASRISSAVEPDELDKARIV